MNSEESAASIFMFTERKPAPPPRSAFVEFFRSKLLCRKDDPEEERKALLKKKGGYRITYTGLSEHRRKYVADIYITLIDLEWRYAIAVLFNVFLVTYLVFAFFWWLMAYNNDDFANLDNPDHIPCLLGVKSFAGAVLFSIETQTTIGYGYAYPNAHCAGTLPLIYLQVTLGFFLETVLLGFIFVKIARPKYRANTIIFSKNAVVCQENGQLCLQIRVGDLRKTHLVDAHLTAIMVRKKTTEEGAVYPLFQYEVEMEANGMGDRIFLLWPLIITHKIDDNSPFWDIKPADLCSEKYELLIFLEGTVEATGEVCQARTSYGPKEILWGHRFERVEEYDLGMKRWHIDFTGFDDVVYCQNLRHSAKELSQYAGSTQKLDTTGISKRKSSERPAPNPLSLNTGVRYDMTNLNGAQNMVESSNGAALLTNEDETST
ncbi:G protein-activated inward rectifier potassium channel 4-like [Haliotis rubra]|uniref:G protein-activated inward rectifier potassium channel 4-like n=1 Tax=Haliotis rubra TaxID=36100 RepID=UPI001EE5125C|nr:G protein-activated inward rectifier potassium channel 4-like [Haliotis rubra]